MDIIPKIRIPKFAKFRKGEDVVSTLTEEDLWKLFNIYISDDANLAQVISESGPLGGSASNRVRRYERVLDYESKSVIGMQQLKRLIELCWSMYDWDPLIKQGCDTRAL